MTIPFTHDAFLDVFGRYNTLSWPAVAGLWVLTGGGVSGWPRGGRLGGRTAFALLAAHWGWSAVAYHWAFFRPISPAATWFAVAFLVQAMLLAWLAASQRRVVIADRSAR